VFGLYHFDAILITVCIIHFASAVVAVDSSVRHHLLRGVVSIRLRMLLVGTCRLCGSWSVAGHNHRKVIVQDPMCADLHDMGPGLSGNS